MNLRLDRLPDRETVKISFVASPELNVALADYAEIYSRTYGKKESVAELIPFMLDTFMNADGGFKRARRALRGGASSPDASPSPIEQEE